MPSSPGPQCLRAGRQGARQWHSCILHGSWAWYIPIRRDPRRQAPPATPLRPSRQESGQPPAHDPSHHLPVSLRITWTCQQPPTAFPDSGAILAKIERNPQGMGQENQITNCFIWCRREESNLRPIDYESIALPTELRRPKEVAIVAAAGRYDKNAPPMGQ